MVSESGAVQANKLTDTSEAVALFTGDPIIILLSLYVMSNHTLHLFVKDDELTTEIIIMFLAYFKR
jgi:hypothetical protein